MITQRTRLDMRPGGVMPVVHVSQYDNDAAALIFDLYDGGELFTVPTGSSVLLNGLKPDNYGFSYQAASISGNTVVCNLTTQMTAVAGAVVCELRVRNGAGTQIIGSCNFILQVEAAALTDDTIISDTMIPLIEQAVEIASNLDRYITQTQRNAETAAEAATTATNAANSAQIVDANVTGLYNSIEEAKTNANTAAANANSVAAQVAQQAASGAFKGDKGDKGDSGVTTPVWGMYTMYVDESTGDLWLVTNGEYGSEYWFRYDDETGNLYYCTPEYVEKTVSGELIEITDAANLGALQCKVAFSPIQSGTGDPSPTNIRPISGRTGLTVTAAGKNLFSPDNLIFGYWIRNEWHPGGETWCGVIIPVVAGMQVHVSGNHCFGGANLAWLTSRTDPSAGLTGQTEPATSAVNNTTFTAPTGALGLWFPQYISRTQPIDMSELMIEYGASASAYEPYTAQTYPITWESIAGTVYGGTLDVVSGVLTVTDAQIASYAGETLPGEWISDRDVYVAGTTPTTGAQVVYKLATPQTYQLTPTEVRTMLGGNNIYTDAGTIEALTYVAEIYEED